MLKIIVFSIGFFISFSTFAGDDSGRQQCIRDCSTVQKGDLRYCEKLEGDERSRCRENARKDYERCSSRCDR